MTLKQKKENILTNNLHVFPFPHVLERRYIIGAVKSPRTEPETQTDISKGHVKGLRERRRSRRFGDQRAVRGDVEQRYRLCNRRR